MTKAMETKKMGLNENEEEQDNQAKDNEVEVCTDDEERNADEDNNEDSNEETHDQQDDCNEERDDGRNGEDGETSDDDDIQMNNEELNRKLVTNKNLLTCFFYINSLLHRARDMTLRWSRTYKKVQVKSASSGPNVILPSTILKVFFASQRSY